MCFQGILGAGSWFVMACEDVIIMFVASPDHSLVVEVERNFVTVATFEVTNTRNNGLEPCWYRSTFLNELQEVPYACKGLTSERAGTKVLMVPMLEPDSVDVSSNFN